MSGASLDGTAWQPIATAPKDGSRLLLFSTRDGVSLGAWNTIKYKRWELVDDNTQKAVGVDDHSGWYGSNGEGIEICAVTLTHWMPLPDGPRP